MSESPCVGIDLGTTYSAVAIYGEAGVELIANDQHQLLTPSVVEYRADGETVVGAAAQHAATLDPDRVFSLFKRQMGTDASYLLDARRITPVDLSALVLGQLRRDASHALGTDVVQATITVPAYFGDDPRLATRQAAQSAGLEVRDLVHEPTAAAIAFGFGQASEPATLLVYDLGGGTFDVTIVKWSAAEMVVLATCGDHRLGGANWDAELTAMVAEEFESRHGVDPREDTYAAAELQERAETAKRSLSHIEQTAIAVVCEEVRDRVQITRQDFEQRTKPLLARTEWLVSHALDDARLRPADLDAVLLVGGSTRMPMCAAALHKATGLEPAKGVDPDQAVARGAALLAATRRSARGISKAGAGMPQALSRLPSVQDVTPHALGFVVISADESRYVNEVMIARNAAIPTEQRKVRRLDAHGSRQTQLQIYLLQGDSERPLDTAPLGSWTFNEVPAGADGHADVEIAFRYDLDGVVEIAARVDGIDLVAPLIDREDRDISWTDEDPRTRPVVEPLNVILAIDCSSSMHGRPIREAERACTEFIQEVSQHPRCRVGIVGFATRASDLLALRTVDQGSIDLGSLRTGGSTNMADGLARAGSLLQDCPGRRAVVLLTDGYPDDPKSTEAVAARLIDNGLELHPRGVPGADEAFLRKLASADGDLMTDVDALANTFRGIARQLGGRGLRRI
jgi:molecular chaperone DnaK